MVAAGGAGTGVDAGGGATYLDVTTGGAGMGVEAGGATGGGLGASDDGLGGTGA